MENKVEVLYAEDDPEAAGLTVCILEEEGFQVRHVADGKAAWEAFRKKRPDILMLDLEMPRKNGIELVGLVRSVDRDTPIVLYTGYASPENEVVALNEGANDFIDKASHPKVLIARLRSIYSRMCQYPKQPHVYVLSPRTSYNSVSLGLKIDGNEKILKPLVGQLLTLLCAKCNDVAGQLYLMRGLWGSDYGNKESEVKKYISLVRACLCADESLEIKSMGGGGYSLLARELRM